MAADVITRFKLETTQFNSKLRDAAKELQGIARQAENAGKDFAGFDKGAVEAARALGTVASGATNTKDKLKDLVGSFNDAAKAYNALTKEQQQSDFGKAMTQSLQTLQSRIKETKDELYSLKDVGGKGGGLFGGNGLTGALAVAGGNLIASGVTKLAGEMKDTIQQSVELAKAGEGVRLAFERLNKPGLLDNLKEATHGTVSELELMKAAVKFDDFKLPVEELGTLLAFAQKKAKDTGQSVDYMVDSIVTGLGRKSLMILDNLGLSAAQIKDRMKEGGDMTKAVAEIIREEMEKAGEYVETAADRAARAAADASDKMENLGRKAIPMAESWTEAWNSIKIGGMELLTVVLNPIADSINYINSLLASTPEDVFTKNWKGGQVGSNIDDKGNYIKRPAQKGAAGFDWDSGTWKPGYSGAIYNGATGQTELPEITVAGTKITKTKPKKGGSGSKAKVPTIADFEKFIGKATIGADALKGSDDANFLSPYAMMLDEIKEKILDVKDADLGSALEIPDVYKQKMDEYAKGVAALKTSISTTASLVGTIGQAFGAIEDPAAKVASIVAQAIANIALAYSDALAKDTTSKFNIFGFIAASAASMVSMATAIAQVHSATGYAQGGMIKGNSYSGDNIGGLVDGSQLVGLNAGELVLTKAQQSNLANSLQGNGGNTVRVVGKIAGKDLFICAENWAKSVGKGEFVTW